MTTTFHIPAPSELTPAHREAMARIQSLAITISQQGTHAVSTEYVGHTHEFSAHTLRFSEIAKGNFKADITLRVLLPSPIAFAGDNALAELNAMVCELAMLLVTPKGDAA